MSWCRSSRPKLSWRNSSLPACPRSWSSRLAQATAGPVSRRTCPRSPIGLTSILPNGDAMTDSVGLIRRLHQHRAWVNGNLLRAAEQLNEEQLHRSFPIGQGSIWQSLLHLLAAEFVWLEALLGNDDPLLRGDLPRQIPGNQLGEGGIRSLAELRREWAALQQRWDQYLAQHSPASLDELVHKFSTSYGLGKRSATRRLDVLLHVCTHAQYTTAQVVNMLRHLGVSELPETMLITLARQEAAQTAS